MLAHGLVAGEKMEFRTELDLTGYVEPKKYEAKRTGLILPQRTPDRKRAAAGPLSSPAYFDASPKNHKPRRKLSDGYPAYRYSQVAQASQALRLPDPKPVKVHVHADMLRITYTDAAKGRDSGGPEHGGGIRGTVTGFSRASRKRMFEFMASVRNTGSMLFATMTFDDTLAVNSDDWMLACFEAFRKRFERAYPTYKAIWRKEWQDRKSGDYEGMFVPHYHLLIFTGVHYEKHEHDAVSETFTAWAKDAWQQITSSTHEAHSVYGFHVTQVRSRKHAYAYIGKYLGKTENHGVSSGRAWGRIGKFDCSASETISLDADEYIAFRRLIKKWLKTRAAVPGPDAPPEEVEKWLLRTKKQRQFSSRFAKGSSSAGCTIFGLGDTITSGTGECRSDTFGQFMRECQRQISSREVQSGWLPE